MSFLGTTFVTQEAKAAFEVFDENGDGSISAQELVDILTLDTGNGLHLTLHDAHEIIQDFDRTGKGALDVSADLQLCP